MVISSSNDKKKDKQIERERERARKIKFITIKGINVGAVKEGWTFATLQIKHYAVSGFISAFDKCIVAAHSSLEEYFIRFGRRIFSRPGPGRRTQTLRIVCNARSNCRSG